MKTIGIIGLGSIGMRHAENLQKMGHNWVFHDPAKDASMSRERIFADDVDAVIISSPTPNHLKDLHDCIEHKKHVFIEKPIGDDWDSDDGYHARRPIDAARRLGLVVMVGYNLRNHSCVKKAREWLDVGLIGKPLWANFTLGQYSEKPPYLRDGVILNWSHEIDLALYLLGAAKVAASSTRLTDGKDDMTDILLTHESGCRSTVHLDYITKPEVRQLIIGGTNGTIEVYLLSRAAYLNSNGIIAESAFRGKDTWNDNYIEEMQAFIDRIDGKETIGCSGKEGLEVLKICLEVRRQASLM